MKMFRIIAVDFDGTLFEDEFPQIGEPIYSIINEVKREKEQGSKLILWTCRVNDALECAVNACKAVGILFDAINENIPEMIEYFGENPRKITATEYWDDKAVHVSTIKNRMRCQGIE